MNTFAIDTLAYADELKTAGLPADQAEAQARALGKILHERETLLATKTDLQTLEKRLESQIDLKLAAFDHKLETKAAELDHKIVLLGHNLTIRLGSMMAGGIFIVAALIKFL